MKITIAIVTYERPDILRRTLDSILDQTTVPDEVIIIDDSSGNETERTVADLRTAIAENGINFTYRHRDANSGMADARNNAIALASGDVICFIDDDVVCEPEWLSGIIEGYQQYPAAVAVGGPAIDTDTNLNPIPDLIDCRQNPNIMDKYGGTIDKSDRWVPPHPVPTDLLRGANMSFRTSILEEIGGFDNDYEGSALYEDTDVMARLWKRNETVLYHPKARVNHIQLEDKFTRKSTDEVAWYWEARNSIIFRKKNFDDVFLMSLIQLLIFPAYPPPPPIYKQLYALLIWQDQRQIRRLRGYIDGLVVASRTE